MATANSGGCVPEMTDAMVPDSMMGKMGRIQVGIMLCSPKLYAEKTYEYCPTATLVVTPTYNQNATWMTHNSGPVSSLASTGSSGTQYRCVDVMMVAMDRKKVGKKKPSRGWVSERVKAPLNR